MNRIGPRLPGCVALVGLCLLGCGACGSDVDPTTPVDELRRERAAMLSAHIEARGITDPRVLAAMRDVPRHEFVPEQYRNYAYADSALPIEHEQTISQPYIVAFMTDALQLKGGEKVLEIGTGSGYQAAVLVAAGCRVFSIEIIDELARSAKETLERLGYSARLRCGDGYRGWPEEGPFDRIIVTAAPDHVPAPLVDQLAEGGRMILPVGGSFQELVVLEKVDGQIVRRAVLPVRFVPMTGEAERRR